MLKNINRNKTLQQQECNGRPETPWTLAEVSGFTTIGEMESAGRPKQILKNGAMDVLCFFKVAFRPNDDCSLLSPKQKAALERGEGIVWCYSVVQDEASQYKPIVTWDADVDNNYVLSCGNQVYEGMRINKDNNLFKDLLPTEEVGAHFDNEEFRKNPRNYIRSYAKNRFQGDLVDEDNTVYIETTIRIPPDFENQRFYVIPEISLTEDMSEECDCLMAPTLLTVHAISFQAAPNLSIQASNESGIQYGAEFIEPLWNVSGLTSNPQEDIAVQPNSLDNKVGHKASNVASAAFVPAFIYVTTGKAVEFVGFLKNDVQLAKKDINDIRDSKQAFPNYISRLALRTPMGLDGGIQEAPYETNYWFNNLKATYILEYYTDVNNLPKLGLATKMGITSFPVYPISIILSADNIDNSYPYVDTYPSYKFYDAPLYDINDPEEQIRAYITYQTGQNGGTFYQLATGLKMPFDALVLNDNQFFLLMFCYYDDARQSTEAYALSDLGYSDDNFEDSVIAQSINGVYVAEFSVLGLDSFGVWHSMRVVVSRSPGSTSFIQNISLTV